MSVPRVLLLAVLLLFSQTYLAREWLAALVLLTAAAALVSFLAGIVTLTCVRVGRHGGKR